MSYNKYQTPKKNAHKADISSIEKTKRLNMKNNLMKIISNKTIRKKIRKFTNTKDTSTGREGLLQRAKLFEFLQKDFISKDDMMLDCYKKMYFSKNTNQNNFFLPHIEKNMNFIKKHEISNEPERLEQNTKPKNCLTNIENNNCNFDKVRRDQKTDNKIHYKVLENSTTPLKMMMKPKLTETNPMNLDRFLKSLIKVNNDFNFDLKKILSDEEEKMRFIKKKKKSKNLRKKRRLDQYAQPRFTSTSIFHESKIEDLNQRFKIELNNEDEDCFFVSEKNEDREFSLHRSLISSQQSCNSMTYLQPTKLR